MEQNNQVKKYKLKKDRAFYSIIIFTILFVIISICVYTHIFDPIDNAIASFMLGIRNDKLTNVMSIITNIGGSYSLICISIIIFIITIIRSRKLYFTIIINLVTVFLTSQIFKLIFHRSRPNTVFLAYAHGYSYPSGHTMVGTAYFVVLIYLLSKKIKNKTIKVIINILGMILIALIALSRLYLGVHYFSDIIAGFILAIIYLNIFLKIIKSKEVKS